MEPIKRLVWGVVETNGCNFKCDYCYLAQAAFEFEKERRKALAYPLETVLQACSKERLGGVCQFGLVGDGETLFPDDIVDLICGLIREGHYVSIVTNGTMRNKIHVIVENLEKENLVSHLGFSVSLHYLELKRLGMLESFAENIAYLKEKGVSVSLLLTLGPSYMDVSDEILEYCREKLKMVTGVNIANKYNPDGSIEILTDRTEKEYFELAAKFGAAGLEYQKKMHNKPRTGFCYAGEWSFIVNFSTGLCHQCVANEGQKFNFFENLEEPLQVEPVGRHCKAAYCVCGYADTYNLMPEDAGKYGNKEKAYEKRAEETRWIQEEMFKAISADLSLTNRQYSVEEQQEVERNYRIKEYLKQRSNEISYDYQDGNHEIVIEKAEKLLENDIDPKVVWAMNLVLKYGYALLNTGNEKKALDLESCYADMKYCGDYCLMMGLIFLRNGMIEEAVNSFFDALSAHAILDKGTNSYLPNYNLGVIYECQGQLEKAIRYYEAAGKYELAEQRLRRIKTELVQG